VRLRNEEVERSKKNGLKKPESDEESDSEPDEEAKSEPKPEPAK